MQTELLFVFSSSTTSYYLSSSDGQYMARSGMSRLGVIGRVAWLFAGLSVLLFLSASGLAEESPSTQATSVPTTQADQKLQKDRERMFTYLTKVYSEQAGNSSWVTRGASIISLSNIPTDKVTNLFLDRLAKEPHPVARLVVWQAILSRAGALNGEQFAIWEQQTNRMMSQNLFQGDLRVGLLEMLSSRPLKPYYREYFTRLFDQTSSLYSGDILTLVAMGKALQAWGSKELMEFLLSKMSSPDTEVRAELILQAAGVSVPWNRTENAESVYRKWWAENQAKFTADPPGEQSYKKLQAQFLPAMPAVESVQPNDLFWRKDYELGDLNLRKLDLALVVDRSASMYDDFAHLRQGFRTMFAAFSMIAAETRISLTFFTAGGQKGTWGTSTSNNGATRWEDVVHLPLTGDVGRLASIVENLRIAGGGTEDWTGGLNAAIKGSQWSPVSKNTRRVIVMMSDERITGPKSGGQFPHDEWCVKLAEEAAKQGFRIYSVMICTGQRRHNPLSCSPFPRTQQISMDTTLPEAVLAGWEIYRKMADITGAKAITVNIVPNMFGLGGLPKAGERPSYDVTHPEWPDLGDPPKKEEVISPVAIAPLYVNGLPTTNVLAMVLMDVVNPQYSDRMEPLVKVLIAYCQKELGRPDEHRTWGSPDQLEPNRN